MANKNSWQRISEHCDRDEIISKLSIGISPRDIHEWLVAKYSNVSEKKFVIAESALKTFKNDYLDIYISIKNDFFKTKTALVKGTESDLELSIQGNKEYKDLVIQTVGKELDLKNSIGRLCTAVETRLSQIYDSLQEDPRNMNTRVDRVLIEYANSLGGLLEKAYKIIHNGPDQIIQHNVSVQHTQQQTAVFYEAIKEVLQEMDIESSMYFMERFNEKMNKLQDPMNKPIIPVDERMAEVKILNNSMNKQLNQ